MSEQWSSMSSSESAMRVQGLFVVTVINEAWKETSYLHQRCWRPWPRCYKQSKEEVESATRTLFQTWRDSRCSPMPRAPPHPTFMLNTLLSINLIRGKALISLSETNVRPAMEEQHIPNSCNSSADSVVPLSGTTGGTCWLISMLVCTNANKVLSTLAQVVRTAGGNLKKGLKLWSFGNKTGYNHNIACM